MIRNIHVKDTIHVHNQMIHDIYVFLTKTKDKITVIVTIIINSNKKEHYGKRKNLYNYIKVDIAGVINNDNEIYMIYSRALLTCLNNQIMCDMTVKLYIIILIC